MPVQHERAASSAETAGGGSIDAGRVGISPAVAAGRARFGDVVTLGFAMTVAVWTIAYLCRMPVVNADGRSTVALMLAAIFLGGGAAGRYSHKGVLAGLAAGAISGLLDILIVGSLIHDYMKSTNEALVPSAALWIGGSLALNVIVAGMGAVIGARVPSRQRDAIAWPRVGAVVLCCATLPLITAGGLVTAFRAGMAVPDWPQSFQFNMFLFPLSMMQKVQDQGKFFEHAHRLMGSLVGLTSLALALYLTFADTRRWVKLYAWGILLAVCVQGLLGGTRVTENSIGLAIAHGVFAQVVFGAMASLAAITAREFIALKKPIRTQAAADWLMAIGFLLLTVVQLTLGALLRHRDMLVLVHITFAAFVALVGFGCGVRAWSLPDNLKPLQRAGAWLMVCIGVQIFLGIVALVFRRPHTEDPTLLHAVLTTMHQANGAILMAVGAVQAAWVVRSLRLRKAT